MRALGKRSELDIVNEWERLGASARPTIKQHCATETITDYAFSGREKHDPLMIVCLAL